MAFLSGTGLQGCGLLREKKYQNAINTTSALKPMSMSGERPVRLEENVAGDLFVASTCIDCDTCRAMAPATFKAIPGYAVVHKQPETSASRNKAYQALLSCPVGAIRTNSKDKETRDEIERAKESFPKHVSLDLPGVFINGFNARNTFGATSYTLLFGAGTEAGQGAMMLDSPRFSEQLARQIERLAGGPGEVKYLWLSHRDDVGDHAKWQSRFNCKRIIHEKEANVYDGTDCCEMILSGDGPWSIDEDDSLRVFTVPGHSAGHLAVVQTEKKIIFTGDHLAMSGRTGRLTGFPRYNHHSWEEQIRSMQRLAKEEWVWVLPGHGRIHRFQNEQEKKLEIAALVEQMKLGPV